MNIVTLVGNKSDLDKDREVTTTFPSWDQLLNLSYRDLILRHVARFFYNSRNIRYIHSE